MPWEQGTECQGQREFLEHVSVRVLLQDVERWSMNFDSFNELYKASTHSLPLAFNGRRGRKKRPRWNLILPELDMPAVRQF